MSPATNRNWLRYAIAFCALGMAVFTVVQIEYNYYRSYNNWEIETPLSTGEIDLQFILTCAIALGFLSLCIYSLFFLHIKPKLVFLFYVSSTTFSIVVFFYAIFHYYTQIFTLESILLILHYLSPPIAVLLLALYYFKNTRIRPFLLIYCLLALILMVVTVLFKQYPYVDNHFKEFFVSSFIVNALFFMQIGLLSLIMTPTNKSNPSILTKPR